VIGEHHGIAFYTVGQRQGLGIFGPSPSFVLEIDASRNALTVGPKAALYRRSLLAHDVRYVCGRPPQGPLAIQAKIRYNAGEQPATLEALPDRMARVTFSSPQPAITPGQGVVFYQGDIVLGGGLILAPGPREG
jgi:tRNA-specific 2-thiouridylase